MKVEGLGMAKVFQKIDREGGRSAVLLHPKWRKLAFSPADRGLHR
jgi:hypothetical protein